MTSQLADCRARLDWTRRTRDKLNREIIDHFTQKHPQRILLECNPDDPDEILVFAEPPSELPEDWPMVFGDMFHNIRAALDNLVWLLAVTHSGPAPWPIPRGSPWRKVQFPIYNGQNDFDYARSNWGHLIEENDWAILDSVQPHARANYGSGRFVSLIGEMNNADKHRSVHLLATKRMQRQNPELWAVADRDCLIQEIVVPEEMVICRGKTELARIRITRTGPNPKVNVQEAFGFDVAVDHAALGSWAIEAIMLATILMSTAGQIVEKFAERFPD